jgi:putative hemolysin
VRFPLRAAAVALAVSLFSVPVAASASPTTFGASPDSAANAYCRSAGGRLELRVPVYGTNGSQTLLLNGAHVFCRFTASDGSHIHIFADTLYSTLPTLAALAYYSQVPLGSCNGNPASCYCTLLGGSDQFGGTSGAGGAWVSKGEVDQDLETCIFPDLSSIDSWGLAYHSAGIIRGIDLSTVLRYADPYAKKRIVKKA